MNKKRCLLITVVVVATVLLLNLCCTASTNNEPIITSLEPDAEGVVPLGSVQVVCTAWDPDGDELNYGWSASAGEIDGTGDTVTWIAPESEGFYSVAVEVTDGRGGEAMDSVAITVRTNDAPTIASLTAGAEWTAPLNSVQVTCSASDPDGDAVSYEWSASGGDISGTGAVAGWTAPQKLGIYDITVVVTDSYGSSATDSVAISVATGQPPNIEALLVTAEHCYLQTHSWGYRVGKGQEYDFECIVSDMSGGVFYEWSHTDGEISEISQDGSIITWIAPDASTWVTVTVVVSDMVGNIVSEDVLLEVAACSPCAFEC
jgi:hypothetical protein